MEQASKHNSVQWAVRTDIGLTHDDNEDRSFVDAEFGIFALSDGMGEAITPSLVVEILPDMLRAAFPRQADLDPLASPEAMRRVVTELHHRVLQDGPTRG